MKILNLYCGIGGNRKLWGDEHEITAVDIDKEIANIYKYNFPNDKVIITDAHQYLLNHYNEFDFIWSSPPCPTHSRLNNAMKDKSYIDMNLYQEIILLSSWFKGKWVVENVIPYYKPLIEPKVILSRHSFWSNIDIKPKEFKTIDISRSTKEQMAKYYNMPVTKRIYLRNCLNPKIGKYIINE